MASRAYILTLSHSALQIHVDRYKHGVYSHITGDPFLSSILTRDETLTRFHACERFERCEQVKVNGRESHTLAGDHVVYVNPVNMDVASWQRYIADTAEQLRTGKQVNHLVSYIPSLRLFFNAHTACASWCHLHDTRPCPSYAGSCRCSSLDGWFRTPSTQP